MGAAIDLLRQSRFSWPSARRCQMADSSHFCAWPGSNIPITPRPCGVTLVPSPEHEGDESIEDKPGALRTFRAKRTITGRSWESLLHSQRVVRSGNGLGS